jgi:hypothetical protein
MLRLALLLIGLLAALPAHAQQAAADPTWPNLLHTLVRFNALDLSNPAVIDEYGAVTECKLYTSFYNDDFKWNQVRQAVRKSAQMNVATFPTDYHYDIKLQLDRYDFTTKLFRFTEKSRINNINTFAILSVEGSDCGTVNVKHLPRIFRVVVPTPIYMDGLPLAEADAKAVLKQMDDSGNSSRITYTRFNFRITYVAADKAHEIAKGTDIEPDVRLDAQLDGIEFYLDPEMTKLIYKFEP